MTKVTIIEKKDCHQYERAQAWFLDHNDAETAAEQGIKALADAAYRREIGLGYATTPQEVQRRFESRFEKLREANCFASVPAPEFWINNEFLK